MNLTAEDLASGVLRDRVKVGASLADVDPMNLDSSVSGKAHAVKQHNFALHIWELNSCSYKSNNIFNEHLKGPVCKI